MADAILYNEAYTRAVSIVKGCQQLADNHKPRAPGAQECDRAGGFRLLFTHDLTIRYGGAFDNVFDFSAFCH